MRRVWQFLREVEWFSVLALVIVLLAVAFALIAWNIYAIIFTLVGLGLLIGVLANPRR